MLIVRDLVVDYGSTRAVAGIDLDVGKGQLVILLGPNGAGKTSALGAIAGLVRTKTGTITVGGQRLAHHGAAARAARGIALVPEGRGVLPGLTVRENLALGLRLGRASKRTANAWDMDGLLGLFPSLVSRMGTDCAALSGGEMQMLAIARALACRPRVLLLDEPSLGLAPLIVSEVHELLNRLNKMGTTILLVEQKAIGRELEPDATYLMRRGLVVDKYENTLPPDDVLVELYLGAAQ